MPLPDRAPAGLRPPGCPRKPPLAVTPPLDGMRPRLPDTSATLPPVVVPLDESFCDPSSLRLSPKQKINGSRGDTGSKASQSISQSFNAEIIERSVVAPTLTSSQSHQVVSGSKKSVFLFLDYLICRQFVVRPSFHRLLLFSRPILMSFNKKMRRSFRPHPWPRPNNQYKYHTNTIQIPYKYHTNTIHIS